MGPPGDMTRPQGMMFPVPFGQFGDQQIDFTPRQPLPMQRPGPGMPQRTPAELAGDMPELFMEGKPMPQPRSSIGKKEVGHPYGYYGEGGFDMPELEFDEADWNQQMNGGMEEPDYAIDISRLSMPQLLNLQESLKKQL